jgi:hypothetical protein
VVITATDADGHVYNTSGMPLGGTARFKVEVAGGTVPDADITWTIKEGAGRVAFAGGSTGPEVAVTATSTGAFRLEVDIKGLVITPPHVRPYFTGTVYPAVDVPVTVWIVRDDLGTIAARDAAEIPGLLADANKILWQRGLTLVQSGAVRYLNNDAWRNHTDVLNPANTNLAAMLDSTNSMGNAVELYFVDTLEGTAVGGVCWPEGIVIATAGDANVIAHEVLHDCGLEDIYTVENPGGSDPNPVSGPVSAERVPADWGGGYYPPGLTQRELITRLIMRSGGFGPEPPLSVSVCLPRGTVYGWRNAGGGTGRTLGNAGVGQSAVRRNPGSY